MTFNGCNTGIRVGGGGFGVVVHNSSFTDCTTGIDANGVAGSSVVSDAMTKNIGTLVSSVYYSDAGSSIIVENVINHSDTVVLDTLQFRRSRAMYQGPGFMATW